jgi:hypothetical protein
MVAVAALAALAGCAARGADAPQHVATASAAALAHTDPAVTAAAQTPAQVVNTALNALAARAASYGPAPTYAQLEEFVGYESTDLASVGNQFPLSVQAAPLGTDLTTLQDAVAQLYDDMTTPAATTSVVLTQDRSAVDAALRALATLTGASQKTVSTLS